VKQKSIIILISLITILLTFVSCDTNPYSATADRPAIPIPESYEGTVPEISNIVVVETAVAGATDFNPTVTEAWDEDGDSISGVAGKNIALMNDGVLLTTPDVEDAPGISVLSLASAPSLQFERYWKLLEGPISYAGYTEETHTVTTTQSVSETETVSFTETLSVETTVSTDTLFASASVTASASFSATQEFSNTTTTTDAFSHKFTVSALDGKDCLYAVWQLHERLRYVDEDRETFTDPKYKFAASSIIWDYPTNEVVPVTTYF
jgi:hypothetical protein